ncbi:MAG: AAA family ATPase [Thermoplasmataceae archaeon]
MKIKKVTITNVRNFRDRTDIDLSEYNVFIGKNGSGKSNLAKAIFQVADVQFNKGFNPPTPFQGDYSKPFSIELSALLEKDDIQAFRQTQAFVNLMQNANIAQIVPYSAFSKDTLTLRKEISTNGQKFVIQEFPTLRTGDIAMQSAYINVYVALSMELRKKILFIPDTRDLPQSFSFQGNFINNPITLDNFMTFLTALKLDRRKRNLYDRILGFYKRLVPSIEDLIINPAGNVVSLGEEGSSFEIPAQEISKGTREILVLLAMLVLAQKGSVIFIEEPEVHLHPAAVNTLREIIREQIKNNDIQVIITTHSSEFLLLVSPEDPDVKVIKFVREADGHTSVHPANDMRGLSDAMEELERREEGQN